MKKITLFIVFMLTACLGFSQTTLSVGDIAFVGSNADGTTNADDTVAFVLLKDIDASTQIIFTDMGWNDGTGFYATAGDGEFTWTSGAAMSAGTVVTINMGPLPAPASYSYIGDQLFAIQGSTAAPQFIAGLQFNDITGGGTDANWDGAATSNSTSALPDALTTGTTAVRLVPEQDNWQFSCVAAGGSPITGTPNDIRLIVHDRANWVSNNTTAYDPALEAGCSFTVTAGGDTTPPVITCAPTPAPITAGTDGLAAIPDLVSGTTATDDVSTSANITITQSPTAGTMYNAGVYPVILTATDEAGNSSTCTINVTINEPPFTALAAGDIAFVGFNLDGGDGFAFILLKDIIAGTHIRFTDCGVTNPNTISCVGAGDDHTTWYASAAMTAGDVVNLPGSFMASSILSSIGDQLFAYQGTSASPTFITGIHSNVDAAPTTDADWDGANTSSTTTALPDQLTNGVNAIRLYAAGPPEMEVDNWQFDCSSVTGGLPVSGTPAQLAAIFNDIQYWISSDTAEFTPAAMGGCSYSVLPSFDTDVSLTAGVLIIEDAIDKDDNLTLSYSGGVYTITDNDGGVINCSIPSATGSGTDSVTVPEAGITSVLVRTLGGDDLLSIAFTGDFPVPVNYEGGTQVTQDTMALTGGGAFDTVTHEFVNENDGSVAITGNALISYTGLEPIFDNLSATNRVFNFTGGAETITLSDDANPGDNLSSIDSSLGESVTFINPTASLTINTEVSGGSGADVVNVEGLDSLFDANLTVNGGTDDNVFFQTNSTNIGTGNFDINGQTITASAGVATGSTGAITFTASQNILVNATAQVISLDGDITFNANAAGTLAGVDIDAIDISGIAQITTSGSGNIDFTGVGVSTGATSFNIGISVSNLAIIENTGTGSISLTGTGGNGANANQGLRFQDPIIIRTIDGGITLNGTGGNASGDNNEGVTIIFDAFIEATGSGSIDVVGNAGAGANANKGIVFFTGNMRTAGGGITLNGTGAGSGDNNYGVSLENNSTVEDTANGDVNLNGLGGSGTNANIGVNITGSNTLSTVDGDLIINATGGDGTGNHNRGLRNIDGSTISATGIGLINITANAGGTGVSSNFGYEANNGSIITAGGGITMIAQGNGSADFNDGMVILNGSIVQDTAGGDINLTGFGATGGVNNNNGIRMWNPTTLIETNGGNIVLNGTGGDGTGDVNRGISIYNGVTIQDLGAGNITLIGNGGAGNAVNHGIFLGSATSVLSNGGDISFTGIGSLGSTGSQNLGILILDAATVSTTATGNILMNGSSGDGSGNNIGLEILMPGTSVNTVDGNITLNGTSTATAGANNYGTSIDAIINAAGAGNIEINGTGGNGVGDDFGIYTRSDAAITSNGGDIQLNGTSTIATTSAINIKALTTPITTTGAITATANTGKFNTPAGSPGYAIFDATNSIINGIFAPGQSPGQAIINGNFTIGSGDTVEIEVYNITTPGTEYDQIVVNGVVDITDATLTLVDNFGGTIPMGNSLTIIDNDGADPVVGEFNGIANGSGITFNGQSIIVRYDGGDGNDVVLIADSMPTAVCQDITVQLDGTGNITIVASQVDGGSSDPDGPVTLSIDVSSFDCSDIGPNTVTLTVTDSSGNTDTCTATVTVEDNIAPVIACPADIIVSNDPGVCGAIVNYNVTATDNCSSSTSTVNLTPIKDNTLFQENPGNSNGAGQLMYVGRNGVGMNNRGLITFDVSSSIPTGATITAVSLTMTADHPTATNGAHSFNLHRLLEDWGEGASDNGIAPGSPGGGFGVTAIAPDATWNDAMLGTPWAAGAGGNFNPASSATQTVNLNGPYIWSSATLVSDVQDMLDNPGTNFGWAILGNETSFGTTKRFGTRESGIPPVLEITYTSAGGGATISQTSGLPSGSTFPVGTTTNTFVATDGAGNTATCSFDVTVEDNEAPVITCVSNQTRSTNPGVCSYTVLGTEFDATFADNCGGVIINSYNLTSTLAGEILPIGNTNITWLVSDAAGNGDGCNMVITIQDNELPVANCAAPFTIQLDATGNATITAADIENGSTDNCGIATTTIDKSTFTCADVGPNTITLTVTDVNGNVSTCTTVVTVEDNVAPVANCAAPFTIQLDATGNASITVGDIDAGSTDACGIATTTIDKSTFTCADVGPNTITLTVTDVNGNVSTCTTVVTIEDNVAPVANCAAPFTIQLDATGNASITVGDIDAGSTDACGIATTTIDKSTFTCADV
ncbi:HYR domain-containing protein, partial [Aequorivita sp. F47161]